jgi:hypothetical protein
MCNRITILALLMLTTGCASMDRAMTGQNTLPKDSAPRIGMSEAEVNAQMGGEPSKRQRRTTSAGAQDILIYSARVGDWTTGIVSQYWRAIFTNGKLSEIQELDESVGSLDRL